MIRKFVSLSMLFSFALLLLSSLVLYVEPESRIASWADWSFLLLDKDQWSAVHITGGMLFLFFSFWHMGLNIRPLRFYLTAAAARIALAVSLAICVLIYATTIAEVQPAQFIIDFGQSIKTAQEEKYGTPPYSRAENSTLTEFCSFMRLNAVSVETGLTEAGLSGVESGRTLAEIAADNGLSAAELYRRILNIPGIEISAAVESAGSVKGGRGRRLLEQQAAESAD